MNLPRRENGCFARQGNIVYSDKGDKFDVEIGEEKRTPLVNLAKFVMSSNLDIGIYQP